MQFEEAYHWLQQGERRKVALLNLTQPLTAKQLAVKTRTARDSCSHVLWELSIYRLVRCFNPESRRSRLYGTTSLGGECRKKLCEDTGVKCSFVSPPDIDWDLYGWVCYSHRSTVIKRLTEPMQAATIKKKARGYDPDLRMSANNARDVVKLLEKRGIVSRVYIRGKEHPQFELSDLGKQLQGLLFRADTPGCEMSDIERELDHGRL